MIRDFLAQSDLLIWPQVALVIFFAVFVGGVLFAAFGLRGREEERRIASLPLEGEER